MLPPTDFLQRLQRPWTPRALGLQFASGAALGPVLDNFHSLYGVLEYDKYEISALVTTSLWTPPLFGFAAVAIGGLGTLEDSEGDVAASIFVFVMIYWLSGILGPLVDPALESFLLWPMAVATTRYFRGPYRTAIATAVAGPLVELVLTSQHLYHYTRADFFGVSSWIPAVYFAGAAPVAILAQRFLDRSK